MIDIVIALFIGFIAGNVYGIFLLFLIVASSKDSDGKEKEE